MSSDDWSKPRKLDLSETPENLEYESKISVTPCGPYRLRGAVVHGFKRGSKLLGCPTANLDPAAFQDTLKGVPRGVYCGWAQVGKPNTKQQTDNTQTESKDSQSTSTTTSSEPSSHALQPSPVYKALLSLGLNPQFQTEHETVEAYIVHDFTTDFYGEELTLIINGYLRPSESYNGIDALVAAISRDVRVGIKVLDKAPLSEHRTDAFFYPIEQEESKKEETTKAAL